ncbi:MULTISPECIES: hypothetical protein [Sphingomonas]|jgi:mannose/fructose/N-acetylgalactosamine-specific phosphotransferase system component IIC|uniref:hypothetical protein n=1 Tax=Sphingomonas TaxID=13687 RepID=UPI000975A32D|nr:MULTISPECIES: hypothetical protein [Sphingomonas]OMJ33412.1 hypothetical protein BSZ14_03830 [Sphingomonas sp. Sph1(2015)]
MGIVTGQSSVWQDAISAWAACGASVEDLPDPVSELHAAALLRQYLASVAILGTTFVVCVTAVLAQRPSPASVTIAIVVSMMLGYLLFLTELSAVPQMLRSIPALRSRRLRRMRLMTAVIGALETSLPAGFVLAVMFAR